MSDQQLPPNEETTGIDTYTKWVCRRWLVILSSGEIAVLLLIWGLMGGTITSLALLIIVYSIFFITQVYVATYQLWAAERENKLSIIKIVEGKTLQIEKLTIEKDGFEQEARELRLVLLQREADRKPKLIGSVENILIDPVVDKAGTNVLGARVSLYLGITNASTVPTTISNFILEVISLDGAHHIGYAGHDSFRFGILQQECLISHSELGNKDQLLADRLLHGQKAELGEKHKGWLFFDYLTFNDPNKNFDWNNNIILKVVDAFDEKHEITGGLLKRYDIAS